MQYDGTVWTVVSDAAGWVRNDAYSGKSRLPIMGDPVAISWSSGIGFAPHSPTPEVYGDEGVSKGLITVGFTDGSAELYHFGGDQ